MRIALQTFQRAVNGLGVLERYQFDLEWTGLDYMAPPPSINYAAMIFSRVAERRDGDERISVMSGFQERMCCAFCSVTRGVSNDAGRGSQR